MSASSAPPPLSGSQQTLLSECAALLHESSGRDVAPLTQLHERLIHQSVGASSHADNVAVTLALLPEMRVKLAAGGAAGASKLRLWLLDFLAATLHMDAKTFTPHVVSMLTTMTADEKSERRAHARAQQAQAGRQQRWMAAQSWLYACLLSVCLW